MADLVERLRYRADEMDRRLGTTGVQADLREAAAALEAEREDGWRPIETAPKDGTTVIGFWCGSRGTIGVVNGTNYGITAFNPDSGEWYDASEADNEDDKWVRPDFWRPLPAPPAIDQARGKGDDRA